MNEILQNRIEEAVGEYYGISLAKKFPSLNEKDVESDIKAAFYQGAAFALQNQWISVEEALPEVSNNYDGVKISHIVLIKCAKGAITRARYIIASGEIPTEIWECIDAGFGVGGDDVTHWMLIPELPKGGKE